MLRLKNMTNHIANCISISRLLLVLTLFLVKPLSLEFFVIYLVCGISDAIDGYIARKLNITSAFGETLDSIADFIMLLVVAVILAPYIDVSLKFAIWIGAIACIRVSSLVMGYVRFKTFRMLHSIGNKITGLVLFVFPWFIYSKKYMIVVCTVASISAIKELYSYIIMILKDNGEANGNDNKRCNS